MPTGVPRWSYPTSREMEACTRLNPDFVSFDLLIRHLEFCAKNLHEDVSQGGPASTVDVSLETGFKLRFAGVEAGQRSRPLSHCHKPVKFWKTRTRLGLISSSSPTAGCSHFRSKRIDAGIESFTFHLMVLLNSVSLRPGHQRIWRRETGWWN